MICHFTYINPEGEHNCHMSFYLHNPEKEHKCDMSFYLHKLRKGI